IRTRLPRHAPGLRAIAAVSGPRLRRSPGAAERCPEERRRGNGRRHGRPCRLGVPRLGAGCALRRPARQPAVRIFFAVPRSAWVDLNLRRSLEDMGHQLVRFDFPGWPDDADPEWRRHGKPRTNQALLKKVRAAGRVAGIDLFFGYFYSSVIYPETVDQ